MYVVAQRNTATYKNFVTILVCFYVSILRGGYVCVYVYIYNHMYIYIYTHLMTLSSGGEAITAVISGLLEGLQVVCFGML